MHCRFLSQGLCDILGLRDAGFPRPSLLYFEATSQKLSWEGKTKQNKTFFFPPQCILDSKLLLWLFADFFCLFVVSYSEKDTSLPALPTPLLLNDLEKTVIPLPSQVLKRLCLLSFIPGRRAICEFRWWKNWEVECSKWVEVDCVLPEWHQPPVK